LQIVRNPSKPIEAAREKRTGRAARGRRSARIFALRPPDAFVEAPFDALALERAIDPDVISVLLPAGRRDVVPRLVERAGEPAAGAIEAHLGHLVAVAGIDPDVQIARLVEPTHRSRLETIAHALSSPDCRAAVRLRNKLRS